MAGHAVRALYLEAGVADVAAETGDADAARHVGRPLGRHGRHQDVADRRRTAPGTRASPSATGSSCRPTAPTTRPAPPSRASSGAGGCCWPPARARYADLIERAALQRLRRRDLRRRAAVLLRQPAAAPRRSLRGGRPGPAQRVVLLRLLPAEHHAADGVAGALPGHRPRATCSTCTSSPGRQRRGEPGRRDPARRHDVRLPLVGHRGHPGAQRPAGRLRARGPHPGLVP